ncbi:hypothetical protein [Gephyromycinifex aptenodytis]|uniref:hypothetical protein n=1 Tax=Gephyromycinifex aptenodytis TaxID=2716227 RepID=UPI001D0048EC|nr:hypothetical protein [Gephyromycinifex aptenodytis]
MLSPPRAARIASNVGSRWYTRPRAFLLGVLAIYFVSRLFSGIVLTIVGMYQPDVVWFENEHGYLRMTVLWDSFWYRQIVEDGYPSVLPADAESGRLWQNPWAFYPLFPYLTRGLMYLTGGGFALVGSTLALLLGAVAAVLIAILLRDRVGPRVAIAGVTLWSTFMAAPVLQVAYTESLAMVLLCLVLYFLSKERWLAAGAVALLTGIARPIALPLGFVGLVCVWVRWRRRGREPVRAGEWIAMFSALVACAVSGLIWPLIAWWGTGIPSAYPDTMTAWRVYDKIEPFRPWWNTAHYWLRTDLNAALALAFLAVLTFALVLGPWARALGPQLRAWSFAYSLYLFASLDPSTSIFRYMLCQFPIAVVLLGAGWRSPLPIAGVGPSEGPGGATAAMRNGRWLWVIMGLGVLINLVLQVWWVGVIWHFTPPADTPP